MYSAKVVCPLLSVLASLLLPLPAARGDDVSTTPAPRDAKWPERHEQLNQLAQEEQWELVFIGDSITDAWDNAGRSIWQRYYADRRAGNLGIGGDQTQHVLYRLEHGNLAHQTPKVAVIMIGTNNLGNAHMKPAEVIEGIEAVVAKVHELTPDTQILLLGVFPRGQQADNPFRAQIKEVNEGISRLEDEPYVHYMDIGQVFLEEDGSLSKQVMPDFLHLTQEGYARWAEAIEQQLTELMGAEVPAETAAP